MTFVAVTQRVVTRAGIDEVGAYLDLRWLELLCELGMGVMQLPGHFEQAQRIMSHAQVSGLILSGGNDLAHLQGARDTAPERDRAERWLCDEAERCGLPIIGVCRGAQLLAHRSGGRLDEDPRHAGSRHTVDVRETEGPEMTRRFSVRSYHRWVIRRPDLPLNLRPIAVAEDGTVEAFAGDTMLGVMWHPERESPGEAGREWFKTALQELLCRR